MLVGIGLNSSEEDVLNSLRNSDAYKSRNFKEKCHKHLSAINNLVESAKIYILDNYKNVQDYSELGLNLRYHTGNQIFGLKDKKRIEENRLKRISELTGIAKKLHEISIPDTSRTRSKFLEEYRIKREKKLRVFLKRFMTGQMEIFQLY